MSERCPCRDENASIAYEYILDNGKTVQKFIDESHFIVDLRRCPCGQHFLKVLAEMVDFDDGEDPASRLLVPVDATRVQSLLDNPGLVTEGYLARMPITGKWLNYYWPSDKPASVHWASGPLQIMPHD